MRFLGFSSSVLAVFVVVPAALAEVDYMAQVKPLLQSQCVKCHGASTQKGGLRLDTAAALLKGGGRGPAVVAGNADGSLLLQAVKGVHAEVAQMPYKRGPLDSAQVETLARWVREGAVSPPQETPSDDRHWAYIPPVRAAVPQGVGGGHPVDAFIQARLQRQGLKPAPEAAPETLVRRLFLDLTGLLPAPEQVRAYVTAVRAGQGTEAWSRLVQDQLTSPHHGERWARWWLDQARYADSNGYSIDAPRSMWPYRDWVVNALNDDMPFDQFTVEQLAGDLLPAASQPQLIATGFHRNTQINQEGGIDKEQFRIESVFDRVATTGTVWLGLTVGCAQCHDHKFDAISHKEYFQFFAFLNNQDEPTLTVEDPTLDKARLEAEQKALQARLTAYMDERAELAREWEAELGPASLALLAKDQQKALKTPAARRSFYQRRGLFAAGPGAADQAFRSLNEKLMEVDAQLRNGTTTLVMKELAQPRKTTLFIKGDFTRPADEVSPGVPAILPPLKTEKPNRLDLARWLVRRDNPLTARVLVNRLWQQYFGRGLVETENDFGTMGSAPSHPELLDWLAVELMESGWSLKHMHRLITTSATYRQSSAVRNEAALAVDAGNHLLWRQNRLRLDAEIVRDVCLSASGLISLKMGGPPVFPPIPEGVMGLGQVKRAWTVSKGPDRYRRGLYTFLFRATPPPGLSVFDAPDGFSTCTRRLRSNTPLQALTLLNDSAFVEFATALENIVRKEGMEAAFERCTARLPDAREKTALAGLSPQEIARVLLNLDETITRE